MFVLWGGWPLPAPWLRSCADPRCLCLPTWLDAVHHGLALKSIDVPPSTQSSPSPTELPNRHHLSPTLGGISPGPSPPTIAVILIWGGHRAITVTHRRSLAPITLPHCPTDYATAASPHTRHHYRAGLLQRQSF